MMRSGEEYQGINDYQIYTPRKRNEFRDTTEAHYPALNLPLNITDELINSVIATLEEEKLCKQQMQDSAENGKILFRPPLTPQKDEKPQNIKHPPFAKIQIGHWTRISQLPEDLKVKIYFKKKHLIWESLDDINIGNDIVRRKRKIEIQWSDILSLRTSYYSQDQTGLLEVELDKRPRFFMETEPKPGRHTHWQETEDFTTNQDASTYRRHTLYFEPGVLNKYSDILMTTDNFWSRLVKADNFPVLGDSLYFDIGYGNDNDNNYYSQSETLSFNADYNKAIGHVGFGEGNVNMETQYHGYNIPPMNSSVQESYHQASSQMIDSAWSQSHYPMIQDQSQMDNTAQLLASQAYAQALHETQANTMTCPQMNQVEEVAYYPHNPVIQNQSQMENTAELLASQAYAQALPETQANMMTCPQTNQVEEEPYYPQVGWYLQDIFREEQGGQNMEHTHLDGNFEINDADFSEFAKNDYDKYFNDGGSMPFDL